jgi:hypothetical protein
MCTAVFVPAVPVKFALFFCVVLLFALTKNSPLRQLYAKGMSMLGMFSR